MFPLRGTTEPSRVIVPGNGTSVAAMAIYHFLREGDFAPEDIQRLSKAYEASLEMLRLKDRAGPITQLIAAKIVQVYRKGEIDPPRICARAIRELGVPMPDWET